MEDYATVPEITQQAPIPKWDPDLHFLSTFHEYNVEIAGKSNAQLIIPDFGATQPAYTPHPTFPFPKREIPALDGSNAWSTRYAQPRPVPATGALYAELAVDDSVAGDGDAGDGDGDAAVMLPPPVRTADGELELDDDDDDEMSGNVSDSSEFDGTDDYREELNRLKESAGLQVPNSKVTVARGRRRQKQLSKMTTAERKVESINKREKARQSARDCRKRKKLYIHRLEQHVAKMKHREQAQQNEIGRLKKRVLRLESQLSSTLSPRSNFVAG